MFAITIKTTFQASHRLVMPGGGKEPLHEHKFIVTTEVNSSTLNNMGLVIDFNSLIALLEEITSILDNTNLEEDNYFKQSCSTEMIAQYIFENLEPKLPSSVNLQSIAVTEAPGCTVKFSK